MSGRLKKFTFLPLHEKLLFCEALFFQLWVGFLLKIIPLRWIPRLFAGKGKMQKAESESLSDPEHATLNLIKTAVQRSGPHSMWKNKCLIQSLAARRMLNRRNIPSQLSLGMGKDTSGRTVAHAWLSSGEVEVTGKHGDYHELFVF